MSIATKRIIVGGAFGLVFLLFVSTYACAYSLYGQTDEYGIVHLSTAPRDGLVLIYEGKNKPTLGMAAIRKLIKKHGGEAKEMKKEWIAEHVPAQLLKPRKGRPFPKVKPSAKILKYIDASSKRHKLDPELVYAVIEQESGFANFAVSPKGAQGLMQIMPETQALLGLTEPFDPARNIEAGTRYLRWMMDKFKHVKLALAAYNAGPEAVSRYNGIPPYEETRYYVARILSRYAMLKGI
ncbi:lytic transglycosylase domain-containing protein [Desulfovibrio inopinatus]|uniref:lytic transglycosylase domain-containing protein n=1 Tax=Desulfovibrio inopinatus TaxID=102109 RepID=UPI0003FDDA39|nr:lytic transglycosylase domain-containing protein [Desulfovibrio inopinatus]